MQKRFAFLALALVCASATDAQLVRDWRAVRTENFELVSRYDPAKTGPLLQELEWLRAIFEKNFGATSSLGRPVLILIPDSPYEFDQMSPGRFADGYYAGSPWRDIIVLKQLLNARHGLFHEYSHLVLNHEGGVWPSWFNEGTAEYYATLRREKVGAAAGGPIEAHLKLLRNNTWLPISYFVSVEKTPDIASEDAVRRFYAQSWAYVHMLHLAPAYRDRFPEFRALLAGATSTEEALDRAFSKSPVAFDEEARRWIRQTRFSTERLESTAGDARIESRVIGDLEVDFARATVAAQRRTALENQASYSRLARLTGGRCDLEAALGDVAFAARMYPQASAHYQEALKCGVNPAELSRGLELAMSYRPDIPVRELESLAKGTGDSRWAYLLGTGRFFAGDYEGALAGFDKASGLPQVDEYRALRMRALALAKLGKFGEAEAAAGKLQAMAADDSQRLSARLTVEDVERARKSSESANEPLSRLILRGLSRLDGVVIRVDCLGARARFWVRAGQETRRLLVADPSEVISGGDAAKPLEFACGAQQRAVTVGYRPEDNTETGTSGRILYLEFR